MCVFCGSPASLALSTSTALVSTGSLLVGFSCPVHLRVKDTTSLRTSKPSMLDAVADTGHTLSLGAPMSQNPFCLISWIQCFITATEMQTRTTPVGRILREIVENVFVWTSVCMGYFKASSCLVEFSGSKV